jgi:hypothetical protein
MENDVSPNSKLPKELLTGFHFPFAPHLKRDGEPELPQNLAYPEFFVTSKTLWEQVQKWQRWAEEQPDGALLVQDLALRQTAAVDLIQFHVAPDLSDDTITFLHRQRWHIAQGLREKGYGEIIDKFWPDNYELRMPPPTRK